MIIRLRAARSIYRGGNLKVIPSGENFISSIKKTEVKTDQPQDASSAELLQRNNFFSVKNFSPFSYIFS